MMTTVGVVVRGEKMCAKGKDDSQTVVGCGTAASACTDVPAL
jgi:hypothetical protein